MITNSYPCQDIFSIQTWFNGKQYICKTCHSKAIKDRLPCQAFANNLYLDDLPLTQLESLKKNGTDNNSMANSIWKNNCYA